MNEPKIAKVIPLADYCVEIEYITGERRLFDVKPYISGEWFGKLKDIDTFNTVHPLGNTIEWNGGQDIAPHELWDYSVNI